METKILVVDDEPGILTAVKRQLHPWATERGVELVTAESGEEGFRIVQESPETIAVILSDLRMPGMSGLDFLAKIAVAYPRIVTILLTGYSETRDLIQAIRTGVFSYVLKPWDATQLVTDVRNAFELYAAREHERRNRKHLHDDLRWAGELQQSVMAVNVPDTQWLGYDLELRPVNEFGIGGDYCDVIDLGEGRHLVLVGDVAGHGVKSAFITFMLKTLLAREQVSLVVGDSDNLAALMEWVNRQICRELSSAPDVVVTFAACLIDAQRRRITYANAGNPPLHIIHDGRAVPLEFPGVPLGFSASTDYPVVTRPLVVGDRILFLTDGVWERISSVDEVFSSLGDGPATARGFTDEVMRTARIESFADDVTVIFVTVLR